MVVQSLAALQVIPCLSALTGSDRACGAVRFSELHAERRQWQCALIEIRVWRWQLVYYPHDNDKRRHCKVEDQGQYLCGPSAVIGQSIKM